LPGAAGASATRSRTQRSERFCGRTPPAGRLDVAELDGWIAHALAEDVQPCREPVRLVGVAGHELARRHAHCQIRHTTTSGSAVAQS
jgi:hypothetical protein